MDMGVRVGTAGWSVPRSSAAAFPTEGTHLQRYAGVMSAVEINSSFYRPHAAATYTKWADSTPPSFRFAVKVPRTMTHELRLRQPAKLAPLLARFIDEVSGLGQKLGPLLVQLPPSLVFEPRIANALFSLVRSMFTGQVVCEPRHATWFSDRANDVLIRHQVARVGADPVRAPGADVPGGWPVPAYYRLHGSPRIYWSSYEDQYIDTLAAAIRPHHRSSEVWVIFDNTASGAALQNALRLYRSLQVGCASPE